jgi:hypothetical protein
MEAPEKPFRRPKPWRSPRLYKRFVNKRFLSKIKPSNQLTSWKLFISFLWHLMSNDPFAVTHTYLQKKAAKTFSKRSSTNVNSKYSEFLSGTCLLQRQSNRWLTSVDSGVIFLSHCLNRWPSHHRIAHLRAKQGTVCELNEFAASSSNYFLIVSTIISLQKFFALNQWPRKFMRPTYDGLTRNFSIWRGQDG